MSIYLTLALVFFNFVGFVAARVTLTLYALHLGAHPSSVGVLGGMFYFFPLLLSWPIGTLADRFAARGLLIIGAAIGGSALLLPYFVHQMWAFYVAATTGGLALAFFHVTLQNLIGIQSTPESRARNFSYFSLVGAVTNFTGPLVAGFSIDHFGHANACLVVVCFSLVALALLLAWGGVLPGPGEKAPLPKASLATMIDRNALVTLGTSGLVQLGTDVFQFYLPIYGHSLGLSAMAIGAVLACFAAASFVVRIFLARLINMMPAERLLVISFAAGAAGYWLVPLFHSAVVLGLIAFVFGLGMGCGTPLTVILMFSRSAQGRSGQTLGLRLTSNNAVRVLGPVIFGAVGSAFGVWPVFLINGMLMCSGAVLSRATRGVAPRGAV